MKKILAALLTVSAFVGLNACKDDNPNPNGGGNKGIDTLSGVYEKDVKLAAGKTYYISGPAIFRKNSTLTVDPGVVVKAIKGTKACIIITRGSKIQAQGTVDKPIVFTSNQAVGARARADWGGIVLCGIATVNSTHTDGTKRRIVEGFQTGDVLTEDDILGGGGNNPNDEDNSGVLKYVRIEFAGIALSTQANSELNALTMVGVGRGTQIDYVQASFGGDDSFEWFGGTVNAKHLISFRGLDDDFDTDNGFKGKVQFGVAIRDKDVSDSDANGSSNGFESDNDAAGSDNTPLTAPIFSNMTIVGPYAINDGANIPGVNGTPGKNVFARGAHIRLNSQQSVFNSLVIGFPVGLYLDGDKTITGAVNGTLDIRNTFVGVAPTARVSSKVANITFDINTWIGLAARSNNTVLAGIADYKLAKLTGSLNQIDARPVAGSPLLGAAAFTDTKVATGFDKVTYVGAFAENDTWATGWVNWDPNATNY
ncbi:hypothetical protein [uncultured Chitinophaga sp.]|uniref:hypothetical protein n=1 Tax=uncultured Chitinophaga sp. TaxID=339340 RepID=UPI0025EC388A|nr:hypothetical protein [uncultured Chitinophaga sp.]